MKQVLYIVTANSDGTNIDMDHRDIEVTGRDDVSNTFICDDAEYAEIDCDGEMRFADDSSFLYLDIHPHYDVVIETDVLRWAEAIIKDTCTDPMSLNLGVSWDSTT